MLNLYKKKLNILLIVFIILSYQIYNSHRNHIFKGDKSCNICIVNKKLDNSIYQVSFIDINIVQNIEIKERISTRKSYKILQKPNLKYISFDNSQYFKVKSIPIGYLPNAPPYFS
ncbi:hypothetical protein MNB_SV-15-880 [hydrothermal vent metagenome]|uniref:Uncharacterized protein n=1 Tax=hydrothermal vent metagenome TaxID=652676 RepID=A0A1W1EKD0_9ZZZZ